VDDIQFLQNRLNFEEEFCNMFEALINQNKQIVITCDKPPSLLKLSERMIARMEWGLVAQLTPPDLETRVAILQAKAESRGLKMSQETAFYMLADKLEKPINIFPHIGEKGMSLDNIGYPKEIQKKIILQNNSKIIKLLEKGNDERGRQNILNKSSWYDFIEWSIKNLDLFECCSDGIYRAVIFTHSDFLRTVFKLPNDEKGDYNSLYHVVFNTRNFKEDLKFDYYEL
jgi:hypothetical protein